MVRRTLSKGDSWGKGRSGIVWEGGQGGSWQRAAGGWQRTRGEERTAVRRYGCIQEAGSRQQAEDRGQRSAGRGGERRAFGGTMVRSFGCSRTLGELAGGSGQGRRTKSVRLFDGSAVLVHGDPGEAGSGQPRTVVVDRDRDRDEHDHEHGLRREAGSWQELRTRSVRLYGGSAVRLDSRSWQGVGRNFEYRSWRTQQLKNSRDSMDLPAAGRGARQRSEVRDQQAA